MLWNTCFPMAKKLLFLFSRNSYLVQEILLHDTDCCMRWAAQAFGNEKLNDAGTQSCLWASLGDVSTVCTGIKNPSNQRVPKTSLRFALQEVEASTSCPRRNWHQVWPRATSRTCWQQKPAQVRPMPSQTYSISTRKNCRPDMVPEKRKYRRRLKRLYVRLLCTLCL